MKKAALQSVSVYMESVLPISIRSYILLSLPVPVVFYICLLVLAQAASVMIVTLAVLVISAWRKNHIQTVFFAILILAVPLTLKLLGFSFAGWFSVYPLYALTAG